MKKRILLLLMIFAILLTVGCGRQVSTEPIPGLSSPNEPATIRIAALHGPTTLGLLHLMDMEEQGHTNNNYEFEIVGAPVEIPPLLVQRVIDVAVVPGNLAAVLYNQMNGAVQSLAVVTLGVLHVVDTSGEVHSVADLAGRTIFITGQGATPEFALNYVLTQNGLTPGVDVIIEYRAEPPEIAALLQTGLAEVALLPEPFVSAVMAQIDGLRSPLDLTEEWNRVQPEYGLIMSVVIARREFLESHPEAIAVFMEEYAASIEFMTNNVYEGAQLAVDFGLIPALPIAKSALPRTHLVFITGEEMKQNLTGFYAVLYNENPASIGGELPEDSFFFIP